MEVEAENIIQKIDTNLNADSVEWCHYNNFEHILLCGTYKLQEEANKITDEENTTATVGAAAAEQTRVGGVTAYSLEFIEGCSQSLKERSKLDMCGVLDIKWPEKMLGENPFFGLVNAEGYCQLFSLDEDFTFKEMASTHLSDNSLGLSLGFSTDEDGGKKWVSASDSSGYITLLDIRNDLRPILTWHAHDYEAWITAIHKFDYNFVFSGGDDCRLKGWDVRDNSRPVFTSRRHQMGVCSVQSHPFNEHIFASGSYDEEVLVWDRRKLKSPLSGVSLGGGVWRIKWKPDDGRYILTATMYNGTHIIDCTDTGSDNLHIMAQHSDHNLAYGADWCRFDTTGVKITESMERKACGEYLISTCSFYDHSLHLWKWSPR